MVKHARISIHAVSDAACCLMFNMLPKDCLDYNSCGVKVNRCPAIQLQIKLVDTSAFLFNTGLCAARLHSRKYTYKHID